METTANNLPNSQQPNDQEIAHLVEVPARKRGPGRPKGSTSSKPRPSGPRPVFAVTQGPYLPKPRRTRQSKYPWQALRAPTPYTNEEGETLSVCDQFFVPLSLATTEQLSSAAYAASLISVVRRGTP